jgi:exopolyphosphatase/guanosine-5'-triphosphate,3'-diphosphate pyrophosphatase
VSASRSHQLVAGALVAEATMRALDLSELEICPWALREGVILRRLDQTDGADPAPDSVADPTEVTGRSAQYGARWSR